MQATTVAAQGTAESDFDLATFSVSLSASASTVPTAKAKLGQAIQALNESVDAMKKELGLEFVKNSVRASSNVQEKHVYNRTKNENEFVGHEVTYSLSFDIDDLERVNAVYDALTSINEIRVRTPFFSLKNKDKLNKKALKAAVKKVQERFDMECEMLGLSSADFEVVSWETNYSDSQRSDRVSNTVARAASARMSAMGGGAPIAAAMAYSDEASAAPVINFNAGQASVTVNLEVGYSRKAQ